jgi:hypothetical protein
MKSRIVITLAILGITLLWFNVALQAQAVPPTPLLKVDVPFPFVAGGMELPAAEYDVVHVGNANTILLRRGGYAAAEVLVRVSPNAAPVGSAKLVFNRYGETYFLSEIWTGQDNAVRECFKSSAEIALARESRKLPQVATVYGKP